MADVTQIDGRKVSKKAAPKAPPKPKVRQDLVLPEKISKRRVTRGVIRSGSLQDDVKAFYAIPALTAAFQSAIRGAESGDARSAQQLFEVYKLLGGQKGVEVNVNQNNSNQAVSAAGARVRGEACTPDEIYRQLDEERRSRQAMGGMRAPMQLEATPVDEGEA